MKRILVLLTAAALMAVMMTFSAVPAFALEVPQECEPKDDKTECPGGIEFKDDKGEFTYLFLGTVELKEDKLEFKSEVESEVESIFASGECKLEDGVPTCEPEDFFGF